MPKYKFTYFNAKGRGEVARILFAQAGVKYEDIRVAQADWPALKPQTPFGQLPVLQVDDVQIAESSAINRYLAKQFGYAGKTAIQQAHVDMFDSAIGDLFQKLAEILFLVKDEDKKADLTKKLCAETIPKYLSKVENALVANKGYLVGDSLTYVDLVLLMIMPWLEKVAPPETLDPYPKVRGHQSRIESLPRIAAWIEKRPKTDN